MTEDRLRARGAPDDRVTVAEEAFGDRCLTTRLLYRGGSLWLMASWGIQSPEDIIPLREVPESLTCPVGYALVELLAKLGPVKKVTS